MAIKHKRKSTSAYTWSSGDLVDGQLGLNTADGTIHLKKTDNSIKTIGIVPTWLQPVVQTVTYSATPTIDWTATDISKLTLTGNATITNSGAVDGQKLLLEVKQDGTGSRTISFTSEVRYGSDITSLTLSTAPNKLDRIGLIYNASASKYDVIAFVKGF